MLRTVSDRTLWESVMPVLDDPRFFEPFKAVLRSGVGSGSAVDPDGDAGARAALGRAGLPVGGNNLQSRGRRPAHRRLAVLYASLLIAKGCSVKAVQRRHQSAMETLETNGHLWPDSDDETRNAVDNVLASMTVETA